MTEEKQTVLDHFGMDPSELIAATKKALTLINDAASARGMAEFTKAAPSADAFKSEAIRQTSAWQSEAGGLLMQLLFMADPKNLDSFEILLDKILIHPPAYRDLADWWLYFSALEASIEFQLDVCPARKTEPELTGQLKQGFGAKGKIWSGYLAGTIKRTGAVLAISEINLEVGGGEQATGADFGVILDFDGKTVQPSTPKQPSDHRIIPLLFQAKRYARPTADVSQSHPTRGPQRSLLASNSCASAYIFYENLDHAPTPLPPLVKRVEDVPSPTRTNVLERSLDFATYLLRAAVDPIYAPRADSADDALRMLYSKASPQDLSALVVVSNDPGAVDRYRSGFGLLMLELNSHGDDNEFVHQET